MLHKQVNKLSMYLAVQAVVDSHENDWKSLPGFVTGVDDFKKGIGTIEALAQTQLADHGASAFKAQAFGELADAAFEVAAATLAWAVASSNNEIAARMDYSRSTLASGRNVEVLARCQGILNTANECAKSLADYGITPGKLAALKKKLASFQSAQIKPQHDQATSKAATKALPELFDATDKLLESRLDGLMIQFKDAKPAFFNEYNAARSVARRSGTRSSRDESSAKPSTTETRTSTGSTPEPATLQRGGVVSAESIPTGNGESAPIPVMRS